MPKFSESRVNPQPHGRYKLFVSTHARILFNGVSAFVNHEKQSALQKGRKKLLARQKVTAGKIAALGTQMVPISQTSFKEIERLQIDIVETNKRFEMFFTMCNTYKVNNGYIHSEGR